MGSNSDGGCPTEINGIKSVAVCISNCRRTYTAEGSSDVFHASWLGMENLHVQTRKSQ